MWRASHGWTFHFFILLEYHSFVLDFNGFDLHIFTFFWHIQLLVSVTSLVHVASVLFKRLLKKRHWPTYRRYKTRVLLFRLFSYLSFFWLINPLNPELNPICYLLALLGAHHFLHVSRIRVKSLTIRLQMSYIYIYIWSAYSWCF